MFEHYFAALFSLGQMRGLAHSALPDAPVQPQREGRKTDSNRRSQEPASSTDTVAAVPADPPVAVGSHASSEWHLCPCGRWGVCREDRHGCMAMCKELFPQLDRELDAWQAAYGWLYR